MKKFLFGLVSLFSLSAFAGVPVQKLTCEIPNSFMSFGAQLDPNPFAQGSGLYAVSGAGVGYMYSTARLVCSGNRPDELRCIGYWNGASSDIAEVRTFREASGNLLASFTTSKPYGQVVVTVPCTIR